MAKPALHIQGMHGIGDSIHQRAVLRQLMQTHSITLEASWASVYHDLVGDDLRLIRRPVALRTQTKNAAREEALFTNVLPPNGSSARISYRGEHVTSCESRTVLEAMCKVAGVDYATADFTLPVPDPWFQGLFAKLGTASDALQARTKPWLIYRPLVKRVEWLGGGIRNADPEGYAKVFAAIRDHFFVVSIADLVPGREWIEGPQLHADLTFHQGELHFEDLAALFKAADLVFTSSGFPAILAPAVGTPSISIIGGYELADCHSSGKRFAPMLSIGPPNQCECWSSQCRRGCDKQFDVQKAIADVKAFLSQICIQIQDTARPITEIFDMPVTPPAIPFGTPSNAQRAALLAQMQRQGLKA